MRLMQTYDPRQRLNLKTFIVRLLAHILRKYINGALVTYVQFSTLLTVPRIPGIHGAVFCK
jgi:hypothetical protein